jgi:hypothetical protein
VGRGPVVEKKGLEEKMSAHCLEKCQLLYQLPLAFSFKRRGVHSELISVKCTHYLPGMYMNYLIPSDQFQHCCQTALYQCLQNR